MYRELQPFREALSRELKASLFPAVAGLDPNKLLETYLDRLTMFTGVDVADHTFTALALDAGREILGSLDGCPNEPAGFERFVTWARDRDQHGLRIIAVAGETTGIYYWALWDFLGEQPDVARVLYNPRTTEHMGEVLSKKVRNELVDALLLAEQLRLGSTPEVLLQDNADLLTARYYSRSAPGTLVYNGQEGSQWHRGTACGILEIAPCLRRAVGSQGAQGYPVARVRPRDFCQSMSPWARRTLPTRIMCTGPRTPV